MFVRFGLISLFCSFVAFGCGGTQSQPTEEDLNAAEQKLGVGGVKEYPVAQVRVQPRGRTPLSGPPPTISFLSPNVGSKFEADDQVLVKIGVENWPLEPAPGKHVHLVIDNLPYIALRDLREPIDLKSLFRKTFGRDIAVGHHVLRAFPSRSHHESVKTKGAFAITDFVIGEDGGENAIDFGAPLLTYSRPKGCAPVGEPLMLDYYLTNTTDADFVGLLASGVAEAEMSPGQSSKTGDVVQNGIQKIQQLQSWEPYNLVGLVEGELRITLELFKKVVVERDDGSFVELQPIPGPFNRTTRTIQISQSCD